MVSRTLTVNNPEGLHMRPAGVVAKEMGKFACDVTIVFGDKRINAKSLINIISACIKKGAEVTFECDGADEEEAMAKVVELESQNFGEWEVRLCTRVLQVLRESESEKLL